LEIIFTKKLQDLLEISLCGHVSSRLTVCLFRLSWTGS